MTIRELTSKERLLQEPRDSEDPKAVGMVLNDIPSKIPFGPEISLYQDLYRRVDFYLDPRSLIAAVRVCTAWSAAFTPSLRAVRKIDANPLKWVLGHLIQVLEDTERKEVLQNAITAFEKGPATISETKELLFKITELIGSLPKELVYTTSYLMKNSLFERLHDEEKKELTHLQSWISYVIGKDPYLLALHTEGKSVAATCGAIQKILRKDLEQADWGLFKNVCYPLLKSACCPDGSEYNCFFSNAPGVANLWYQLFNFHIKKRKSREVVYEILSTAPEDLVAVDEEQIDYIQWYQDSCAFFGLWKEGWSSVAHFCRQPSYRKSVYSRAFLKIWFQSFKENNGVSEMIKKGCFKEIWWLAEQQAIPFPEHKYALIHKMGTTYIDLHESSYVQEIIDRLAEENGVLAKQTEKQLNKELGKNYVQDGKYEEACECFERAQLSKRKQFNIFKTQAQIAIKQGIAPAMAYRLIQISLQILKEAGDDTSFFRQVLDHRIVSLLCKVGQKKEAKALLDQAVQVFRQLYPEDKDFFLRTDQKKCVSVSL